jgi:hypothetical protein
MAEITALPTTSHLRPPRPYRRPAGAGPFVVALVIPAVIFLVIVTRGFEFTNDQPQQSRFFENQAVSILHGRIDVPEAAIGLEQITLGGKYYGYFGPTPALLRLPVMLFFSSRDPLKLPFLAPIYMTLGFLLAGLAIAGIASKVGLKGWLGAGFTFLALTGSALMMLSSRALLYEEATIWGASFALVTIFAALHFLESPSTRWAIIAIAAAALAISARPTAGIGAIAVIIAAALLRRSWWVLAGALVVPVGMYAAFMLWKFGALYPPQTHQLDCITQPTCLTLVRQGSTQMKFIPTNVVQYFRPDLLRFGGHFPWIQAPDPQSAPVKLIGIDLYLGTDRMSSVTVTMPLLLLLSVVGVVSTTWPRRWLILASCAGPLVTCMYLGATQRYLADFVPVLTLAGACGGASLRTVRWRPVYSVVIAALATWSVLVCTALAVWMWSTVG